MMSLKEIQIGAQALGNMTRAGIPLVQAIERMQRLQHDQADFWIRTATGVADGQFLYVFLQSEWPESLCSAVKAGELSGTLEKTFQNIVDAVKLQRLVQGKVRTLAYPAIVSLLGVGVFVFYLTVVFPGMVKALGRAEHGAVIAAFLAIGEAIQSYWIQIVLGVVVAAGAVIAWIRVPENRGVLGELFMQLPILGPCLRDLYFGMWGLYMALIAESGAVGISEALVMTSAMLPQALRPGLLLMSADVVRKGVGDAGDPAKQVEGDPRREWPFFIGNAFIMAEQTGNLADELRESAPALIEEGTLKLGVAVQVASAIAMFFTGAFVVTPMVMYFMEMGQLLAEAAQ